MNNFIVLGLMIAGGFIVFKIITGTLAVKKERNLGLMEAGKEYVADQAKPTDRVDKKDAEFAAAKSLGGQPLYYNEVDHTFGRFVSLFRTDADMADERVIHNDCYRVRYLKDVTYFWFIKASKEAVTPCVFRPGVDLVALQPGQESGVPSEGLVVLKRSMDGQRLAHGDGERYRWMLMGERSYNKMLADMLIWVQDKHRMAHMDPASKQYVDDMVAMIKRSKSLIDAAGGQREQGFGFGNPYAQEMYGAEDTTPQGGGENDGLWRLG